LAPEIAAAGYVADTGLFVEIKHYVLSGGASDIDLGCCKEEWDWVDE
jgi:hypothetical protein